MSPRSLFYAVIGSLGLAAAVAVPAMMLKSGSGAVPGWIDVVMPGSLAAAHAQLGAQCEACHVPLRGVEAATCITCHALDGTNLAAQSSTAFHLGIGACSGCHVEHRGRERRPIDMDHSVLVRAGRERAPPEPDSALERMRRFLVDAGTDVVGGPTRPGRSLPPADAGRLVCASCHANQDPHRTLLGDKCQACHDTGTWTVAGFRHPSPRSQDCAQCHQAPPSHFMMHFEMIDRTISGQMNARVDQCQLCHLTDSWNNIRGVGWYKHH